MGSSNRRILTIKEKALNINLIQRIYGTLAEIGGGQEVAGQFFRAGGASGSIAKTMSAYDMTFSDAIYGPAKRYVCEEKLLKMLDKEYSLLSKRLVFRAKKTTFFAFANTVETLNFKKTNQGHGWIGLRFQLHPNSEPNDCIIHVILKDTETKWQQQVLGDLGVNLTYGCYNFTDPEELLLSLVDNIERDRIEIDMFRLQGPDFHHVDNRLMSLKLVKNGLTRAAMFDRFGNVLQPSEALYKKNILVMRGRFRPVTLVNVDMLIAGMRQFLREEDVDRKDLHVVAELTLNDLKSGNDNIDESDFLDRVDLISSLGQNVMISNYQEHYKLANYLARFTKKKKIGLIMGYMNLERIFDEKYYQNLSGGILESFGRLFGTNIKLLIYPSLARDGSGEIQKISNFSPKAHLTHLMQYFVSTNKIADIEYGKTKHLHVMSDKVLQMIQKGETGWEKHVPFRIAEQIKEECMFGYKPPIIAEVDEDFN